MYTPTNRKPSGEAGYYTVEAAMFLPLFILAVMVIAYLMNVAANTASVYHAGVEEGRALAVTSYELPTDIGLEYSLARRILTTSDDVDGVELTELSYLYDDGRDQDVIAFDVLAHMKLPLPFDLGEDIQIRTGVMVKAWTGNDLPGEAFGFSRMEQPERADTVYVFPQSGMRYHGAGCPFVSNAPTPTLLTDRVRGDYAPCGHCGAAKAGTGTTVYCYEESGRVYHLAHCRYVEKQVLDLERQDAIDQGYTPCQTCGGN